jgi:hypothetical protein
MNCYVVRQSGLEFPTEQEIDQALDRIGTGTEGTCVYEGEGFSMTIHWDNPFIGHNSCDIHISGEKAHYYEVRATPGNGDEKAQMRFELLVPRNMSSIVNMDVPSVMQAGQAYTIRIDVKNCGTNTCFARVCLRCSCSSPGRRAAN